MIQTFDVVIWGAGIAGSHLAGVLAQSGISVAMIPNGPATKPIRPGFVVVDNIATATADFERALIDRASADGVVVLRDSAVVSLSPEFRNVEVIETTTCRLAVRLLVLADGSDPRIGRDRHVLPEWDPWQLVHFAYVETDRQRVSRQQVLVKAGSRGEFPWRGYWTGSMLGVGWFLEHEMESRVHVSDLLTDARKIFGIADTVSNDVQVEVVPFEPRHLQGPFCVDNVLAIGDVTGVVNPMSLRRTGISLMMAERMSDVIVRWLSSGSSENCDPRTVKAALSAFIGPEFHRDSGPPLPPVPRPPGRDRRLGSIVQRLIDRTIS